MFRLVFLLQACTLGYHLTFAAKLKDAVYTPDGQYELSYWEGGDDTVDHLRALYACPWNEWGDLIVVESAVMQQLAENVMAPGVKDSWIAASDAYPGEGHWIWRDSMRLDQTYTHWDSNQPDNSHNEDCAEISKGMGFYWNDEGCGDSINGYICQRPTYMAKISEYAEYTVIVRENGMRSTFQSAQQECAKDGLRLARMTDEKAITKVQELIKSDTRKKYWLEDRGVVSAVAQGIEKFDDKEELDGTVCETVRPHSLLMSNGQPEIFENQDVEIGCTASGFPLPDVAWFKDEQFVPNQSVGTASSTLLIKSARPADGGTYVCKATSTINGELKEAIVLTILEVLQVKN